MSEYLGISLVVIVVALCIGILSTIVSENIFKQMEAHSKRASETRARILLNGLSKSTEYLGKYIQYAKEMIILDKETAGNENAKWMANETFKKTMKEMEDEAKELSKD